MIEANAAANGVHVAARTADLREEPPPVAPTVTANLTPALHHGIGAAPGREARAPDRLGHARALRRRARADVYGMRELDRRREGAWAAVVLAP